MLTELVLWLFVLTLGISFGAGLYEQRIVWPLWFDRSDPAGIHVNTGTMRGIDVGRRFWAFVSTGPLTLLTLASLVLAWRMTGPLQPWWLAAAGVTLLERAGTFSYFIPTAIRLTKSDALPAAKSAAMASRWIAMNYVRAALSLAAWLFALKALTLTA